MSDKGFHGLRKFEDVFGFILNSHFDLTVEFLVLEETCDLVIVFESLLAVSFLESGETIFIDED